MAQNNSDFIVLTTYRDKICLRISNIKKFREAQCSDYNTKLWLYEEESPIGIYETVDEIMAKINNAQNKQYKEDE